MMRAFKLVSISWMSLVLVLAACKNEKSRLITTTCQAVQKTFTLNSEDYNRCVNDADYRERVLSRQYAEWSQNISESHNRERIMLLPKGSKDRYVRLATVTDLLREKSLENHAEDPAGEGYVITGTLVDQGNGKEKKLALYADADNHRDHLVPVAIDNLDVDQKEFINDFCWVNTQDYSSSMCHGDVYVSVRRKPDGSSEDHQLDGAAFTRSSAETVLSTVFQTPTRSDNPEAGSH